jgi:hypothetical protein
MQKNNPETKSERLVAAIDNSSFASGVYNPFLETITENELEEASLDAQVPPANDSPQGVCMFIRFLCGQVCLLFASERERVLVRYLTVYATEYGGRE